MVAMRSYNSMLFLDRSCGVAVQLLVCDRNPIDLCIEKKNVLVLEIHITANKHIGSREKDCKRYRMGKLTATRPTSISCYNFRADNPEDVKIARSLPYEFCLMSLIASSSDSTSMHTSTVPAISFVLATLCMLILSNSR